MTRNLPLIYAMDLFAGASRGSFLVCLGWTTLILSGSVALVGQVFLLGMITSMIAGPLLGALVDRWNRRNVAMGAHASIAIVMLCGAYWLSSQGEPGAGFFYALTLAIYTLRQAYHLAHDGLIKANVQDVALTRTIARTRLIHLLGTALMTVVTGAVIEGVSPAAGYVVSAFMSVAVVILVWFIRGSRSFGGSAGLAGFLADAKQGLRLLRDVRELRWLAVMVAVAPPLGQLSNAVLSSRIHDDLQLGGNVFGLVDAAWPAAGMLGAALMAVGMTRLDRPIALYVASAVAGVATVTLGLGQSVASLVAAHAVMGFTVWLCHIMIDGRVMAAVGSESIGRAKAGIQLVMSGSAAVMCLSPTLVERSLSGDYLVGWGLLVFVVSLAVGARALRHSIVET